MCDNSHTKKFIIWRYNISFNKTIFQSTNICDKKKKKSTLLFPLNDPKEKRGSLLRKKGEKRGDEKVYKNLFNNTFLYVIYMTLIISFILIKSSF